MTTMELQALKTELINEFTHDVNSADTREELSDKLWMFLHRYLDSLSGDDAAQDADAWGRVPGIPCTREELERVVDDFERQMDAGTLRGRTAQAANARMREVLPWLK